MSFNDVQLHNTDALNEENQQTAAEAYFAGMEAAFRNDPMPIDACDLPRYAMLAGCWNAALARWQAGIRGFSLNVSINRLRLGL
ncbi:MAG: hypothetical protein ACJAWK_000303 [Candidatus Azotimanducaceae bacterium]